MFAGVAGERYYFINAGCDLRHNILFYGYHGNVI